MGLAMKSIRTFIICLFIFAIGEVAAKKNSKLKHDPKEMDSCDRKIAEIKPRIAKLRKDLELVYKCMETDRTDPKWSTYCVMPPATSFSSTGNQVASGRQVYSCHCRGHHCCWGHVPYWIHHKMWSPNHIRVDESIRYLLCSWFSSRFYYYLHKHRVWHLHITCEWLLQHLLLLAIQKRRKCSRCNSSSWWIHSGRFWRCS